MIFRYTSMIALASIVTVGLIVSGCSGSATGSGTADASSVSVSGSFAASGGSLKVLNQRSSSKNTPDLIGRMILNQSSSMAVDYTTKQIRCVAKTVPPVESLGTISATGVFSITVAQGKNEAFSCNIENLDGEVLATLITEDNANTDMNGNAQVNNSLVVSTDAQLGTVNLDLTVGAATVPVAQIVDEHGVSAVVSAQDIAASGTLFNPTGKWQIADVDFTLPKGVLGVCAMGENDCNGPPGGLNLYLKRLEGVTVPGGKPVYGLQVWQDENGNDPETSMVACGSMTGLSASDAANAGVDLSSYGAFDGAFTFATSITDPHTSTAATITNGYQVSTATAQWNMQACVTKTYTETDNTTHRTYVCGPDTAGNGSPGGLYQANLGGGCVVTATGATINNMDWSKLSWVGANCTNTASDIEGFYKNTCTATYDNTTPVTCTNEWGIFSAQSIAPGNAVASPGSTCGPGNNQVCAPSFNYAGVTKYYSTGDLCSNIPDGASPAELLARANCYANYYERYIQRDVNACLPRVETDWSATTAAGFAKASFKPENLIFMEKLSYSTPNAASMLTLQTHGRGVQVKDSSGNTQWINCPARDVGGLSFKKVSPTKLLATYESTVTTTSTEPACLSASWNGQKKEFLFYLIAQ